MRRENRMRHTFYTLAIMCFAVPMAKADPVVLAPAQMDVVTAGYGAVGDAGAIALGPFGFTGSSSNAIATTETLNGNPALAGYAAGSEAVGTATAVGAGSATGTAAITSASVPGNQIQIYSFGMNRQWGPVSISGSATMAFGSFSGPSI